MANTSKTAKHASDFENLVRNGIDFLEKAMSQLDQDPKHSVINFYTAVEIFLKAPLVLDHWALVVVDKEPNRQKYEKGDFISVSFEDACGRLAASLTKPLEKSAREAFDKVRKHRNRMVHFYHSGIDGKQRDEIKLEQAEAWFELNRFIGETWRKEFEPFAREFERMERGLIANNHYAMAKFKDIKPRIDGLTKSGAVFERCPRCKTDAYRVEDEGSDISSLDCLVCFSKAKRVLAECPECSAKDQYVMAYDGFACAKCDHETTNEGELFDLLDQCAVRGTKHDIDSHTPASCEECQGHGTVCEYADGCLCTNCLTYFDMVGRCEWCNEPIAGGAEDTYVSGCEYCDGYAGHHAND